MPIMQSFNKRTKRWVKFKVENKRAKILDVKQKNPTKPFKGVPIKKKR